MPKARRQINNGLPERWRIKHGAYYYRVPPGEEEDWEGRQEYRLGATFDEAMETFQSVLLGCVPLDYVHDFLDREHILERSTVVPKSGIYFLIDGSEVVYVGQSRSIMSRVLKHSDKNFDRVTFLPVDERYLLLVEARYIQKFRPKYNEQCFGNGTIGLIGTEAEKESA